MAARAARFVLLTPRGAGGIGVVAVEGDRRLAVLAPLVCRPDGRAIGPAALAGRGPLRLQLRVDGAALDEVVFVDRPAEARSELHVHGSDAVLAALARAVGDLADAPPACAAERLLRDATSPAQLALALEQLAAGPFAAAAARLRAGPVDALRDARRRSRVARALAEPARCVLVGPQNAGKSTLLNGLALVERALTGPQAGLTRDPVRDAVLLDGYPYEVVDVAGDGPVVDEVDRRARELGARERHGALVLLVADGSAAFPTSSWTSAPAVALVVRSKADLPQAPSWPALPVPVVPVSCVDARHAVRARAAVGRALRDVRGLPVAPRDGVGGLAALDRAEWELLGGDAAEPGG